MSVRIREASLDDASALLAYATKLFSEELPGLYRRVTPSLNEERQFIAGYCEPASSVLLVAESEDRVVGIAGLEGRTLPQERHVGSVGLSVDRDHRGSGIGTELLQALFEWGPAHGVTRIEIEAFANNPDAIRLYERVGFTREGIRREGVIVEGRPVDVISLAWLAPKHDDAARR